MCSSDLELKSVRALKDEHRLQTRMYLRLLGLTDAILINFPTHTDTLEIEDIHGDNNSGRITVDSYVEQLC